HADKIGSLAQSDGHQSKKQNARGQDRGHQKDHQQGAAGEDESDAVITTNKEPGTSNVEREGRSTFDVGRSMLGVPANMKEYPTPWQRKMMWAALTACFVLLLIIVLGAVIWAGANIISFLQPILIPVAIAAILTYLLDPLVTKMSRGTLSR